MSVGESNPFLRKPVYVRRRNLRLVVVAMHVTISEVIGKDENDVRVADVGRLCAEGLVAKERCEDQKDDVVDEKWLHN